MLELTSGIQGVGIDHHQSGTQSAKCGDGILQHIGHHDRNAVAFLQPHGLKLCRKSRGVLVDLSIGELSAKIDIGHVVGECLATGIDHINNG